MNEISNSANTLYVVTGEQLHAFGQQCADLAIQQSESLWRRKHDSAFEKLFKKEEVAKIFGVSLRTIDNWIADRIITPTYIGAVTRIDASEITKIKTKYKINLPQFKK